MVHIFIINPNAANYKYAENLREKLAKIEDLNYFVFYTRAPGDEKGLVKRILHFFTDEKIRLYCCGGSGTICNVINGIDDLSKVEIAFFPCGSSNLFLKSFGEDEKFFYRIENLIYGKVVPIDFLRGSNGSALNSMSVGVDATIINKIQEYYLYSIFGKSVPASLAFIKVFMTKFSEEYDIRIDNRKVSGRYQEIYFGNGSSVGKDIYVSEKADITDGKAITVLCNERSGISLSSLIQDMKKKRFDKMAKKVDMSFGDYIKIRRTDGKEFQINLDGELQPPQAEWDIRVVNKGLNFVVPKGVVVCDRDI